MGCSDGCVKSNGAAREKKKKKSSLGLGLENRTHFKRNGRNFLWCCRGEDNLGIGLLESKIAVQYISRSLVLAQYFLSYDVSKSTQSKNQTTALSM